MKTLYHGTSSHNLPSIKTIGLVPGHAKGGDAWASEHHWTNLAKQASKREPSVFLTDTEADARHFSHLAVEEVGGDPIIITVHVPEHVFATFVVDELYERDKQATPHAWRAHSVDAAYVGKVLPVQAGPDDFDLLTAIASLLQMRREGAHA
jgi:hypothetical protein